MKTAIRVHPRISSQSWEEENQKSRKTLRRLCLILSRGDETRTPAAYTKRCIRRRARAHTKHTQRAAKNTAKCFSLPCCMQERRLFLSRRRLLQTLGTCSRDSYTKPSAEPPAAEPQQSSDRKVAYGLILPASPHLVLGVVLVRLPVVAVPADEEPRAKPADDCVVRSRGSVKHIWPAAPCLHGRRPRRGGKENAGGAHGQPPSNAPHSIDRTEPAVPGRATTLVFLARLRQIQLWSSKTEP